MLAKRSIQVVAHAAGPPAHPAGLDVSLVQDPGRVPPPASPQLQALGQKLKGETERLVEKMVDMIHGIPEYRLVKDEVLWNEVRQILRVNVPVFYNAVIEGRAASDEELAAARYFARRRVHQGIPLRGHLTAYRNGMWILWGELVARVMHRPALQKELLLRAAWAFRHLETISSAVTEAYCAEQEGRARHRDRTLRELFEEIIGGGPSSLEELKARGDAIDLNVATTFNIVVIAPAGQKSPGKGVVLPSVPVTVAVAESAGLTVEQLVAVERGRELILLAATHRAEAQGKALRAKLAAALAPPNAGAPQVVVGISGPVTGVEGIRQGYKEATRAIEIGQGVEPGECVYFYETYVLHDVLEAGEKAGRRLVGGSLGPLLALGETGRRLVDTLDAYFRAGSHLKVAAGLLNIHPNTLAYRMRQIHRLTGLDPSEPEHRLRAEVALRLLALHRRKQESAVRDLGKAIPREAKPGIGRSARRGEPVR